MLPSMCFPAHVVENTQQEKVSRNGGALLHNTMHITRVASGGRYQGND